MKKTNYIFLIFLFLPLLVIWKQDITVTLYNIDDLYLKTLSSGEFTGIPETHLVHIGYFTGLLLKCLYSIAPTMPWYGLMLFSYGYLGIYISIYLISSKLCKVLDKFIYFFFWMLISFAFVWLHLVELQYTTITTIVCAAGMVCFYLSDDQEKPTAYIKTNILSFIFLFVSLELRDKACLMFFPLIFLLGLSKYIQNRKMGKSLLAYASTLLLITILIYGSNYIAYSKESWKSFEAYNTARENVVDYNGYPDYETYREEYEKLGVSYDSYLSATTRYQLLLDENINTEFMLRMEELSDSHSINPKEMVTDFLIRHTSHYADRPLNIIVYILYFFAILLALLGNKKSVLWDIGALFGGRMIIWAYLMFINRPETRVTQGIYIAEYLLLVAMIYTCNSKCFSIDKKVVVRRFILVFFSSIAIFSSVKWGLPHIDMIRRYSQERAFFSVAYREARAYFYEHEENLYLVDTNTFSYFTEDAFLPTLPSHGNFMMLGSWVANSPWSDSTAHRFNVDSYERDAITRDDIYFVFMNGDNTNYEYLETYYQNKYPNTYFKLCDTIYTSNGLEFYVMQVER